MRWKGRRGSENVEDRRSAKGPVIAGGGLLGFIIVVGIMLLGGDPSVSAGVLLTVSTPLASRQRRATCCRPGWSGTVSGTLASGRICSTPSTSSCSSLPPAGASML